MPLTQRNLYRALIATGFEWCYDIGWEVDADGVLRLYAVEPCSVQTERVEITDGNIDLLVGALLAAREATRNPYPSWMVDIFALHASGLPLDESFMKYVDAEQEHLFRGPAPAPVPDDGVTDETDMDFIERVLRATSGNAGGMFYRGGEDDPKLTIYGDCSDFFAWGGADAEEITPENVELLESTIAEARAATGDSFDLSLAICLFIARLRGLRPQGAQYERFAHEDWWIVEFDAAGPPRSTGMGNPRPSIPPAGQP